MLPLETFYPPPSAMNHGDGAKQQQDGTGKKPQGANLRAAWSEIPSGGTRSTRPRVHRRVGRGTTASMSVHTPGKADHRKLEAPVYRILINMGV